MSFLPIVALRLSNLATPYCRSRFNTSNDNNRLRIENEGLRSGQINLFSRFAPPSNLMNQALLHNRWPRPRISVLPPPTILPPASSSPLLPLNLRMRLLMNGGILGFSPLLPLSTVAPSPVPDITTSLLEEETSSQGESVSIHDEEESFEAGMPPIIEECDDTESTAASEENNNDVISALESEDTENDIGSSEPPVNPPESDSVQKPAPDESPLKKRRLSFTAFVIKKLHFYFGINTTSSQKNRSLRTAEKAGKFAARLILSPTLAVAGFTGTVWNGGKMGSDFLRGRISSYPKDQWKKSYSPFVLDLLSLLGSSLLLPQLSYAIFPGRTESLFSGNKAHPDI